jgi:hypothetical protein
MKIKNILKRNPKTASLNELQDVVVMDNFVSGLETYSKDTLTTKV